MYTLYDRIFFWTLIGLVCIGFIINFSGSIPIGIRLLNDPYYFIKREIFYYFITFFVSLIVLKTPIMVWRDYSFLILFFNYILLLITLIINHSINGASRWIVWGAFYIQPSELSKLSFICYLANYLTSKSKASLSTFWGICKPILMMIFLAILLLMQPDFGSIIVLFITTLSILFFFGVKFCQLILIFIFSIFLVILSIVFKPYRIQRILSFWNPWEDPFGDSYQLVQSLIAFGQGRYFGQGLGNSIQKLEYLPEAHTDFIFSIFSEEMGCFGSIILLCMLFIIVFRSMYIGYNALNVHQKFSGVLAFSIGLWLSCQIFINIGMVEGILPTKGLTLPFISYGGSSFLTTVTASILLLRIDFETRVIKRQAFLKVYSK